MSVSELVQFSVFEHLNKDYLQTDDELTQKEDIVAEYD